MLTIKIKIKEKDGESTNVELIAPTKTELEKASKNEKNATAVVFQTINDALKNAQNK